MSAVFWDTNLFIYLFEDKGERGERVAALRARMLERSDRLFTSALTIGEILVKPAQTGRVDITRQYEQRISEAATVIPFDLEAARRYAGVRAGGVKGADAIQLACAAAAGINLFITNDDRLAERHVPGIDFIVPLGRVPL